MTGSRLYAWIRTAGFLSLIPLVLAGGPLAGYLAGDLLVTRFHFPSYALVICVIIGCVAGIRETVVIIRAAIKQGT
jgi:hypothetical protein